MREKDMQENLLGFLEKKFKKAKINIEYPLIHGTADVLMIDKNEWYFFEIKENVNLKVFEQASKHKGVADYLFVVANKPAKKETIEKWENFDKTINVMWVEDLKKKLIRKAVKNEILNKNIRRRIYE